MATHGGKRKGAGRKTKAEEQTLIERLSPLDDAAHQQLELAVKSGEQWAVKLFFEYRYGKPKQSMDLTGELRTVNVPIEKWIEQNSE